MWFNIKTKQNKTSNNKTKRWQGHHQADQDPPHYPNPPSARQTPPHVSPPHPP